MQTNHPGSAPLTTPCIGLLHSRPLSACPNHPQGQVPWQLIAGHEAQSPPELFKLASPKLASPASPVSPMEITGKALAYSFLLSLPLRLLLVSSSPGWLQPFPTCPHPLLWCGGPLPLGISEYNELYFQQQSSSDLLVLSYFNNNKTAVCPWERDRTSSSISLSVKRG